MPQATWALALHGYGKLDEVMTSFAFLTHLGLEPATVRSTPIGPIGYEAHTLSLAAGMSNAQELDWMDSSAAVKRKCAKTILRKCLHLHVR